MDLEPVNADAERACIDLEPGSLDYEHVATDSEPVRTDYEHVAIDSKPLNTDSERTGILQLLGHCIATWYAMSQSAICEMGWWRNNVLGAPGVHLFRSGLGCFFSI